MSSILFDIAGLVACFGCHPPDGSDHDKTHCNKHIHRPLLPGPQSHHFAIAGAIEPGSGPTASPGAQTRSHILSQRGHPNFRRPAREASKQPLSHVPVLPPSLILGPREQVWGAPPGLSTLPGLSRRTPLRRRILLRIILQAGFGTTPPVRS